MTDDLVWRLREENEYSDYWQIACGAAADAIERKDAALRVVLEALKNVLLDVDFMVEREVIPDIRTDIIYERARDAIAKIEEELK